MEEYLNDSGIFDDEICRMDQKTIDEISQNKINDIQVATSFYEYNETTKKTISNESESDNDVIEESDLVEIGPSEINKVIAEVYFDKVVEEEESVLDKTLEAIGIKPVNVYAGVNYDYYYDENKSYMKRSILVVPTIINGIQYYKILCYYEWLTMPLNRLTDVACITFDANSKFNNNRAAFDNTYAKVTTEYTVTERRELTGERLSVRHDTSVDILKNIYYNENADERELEVGELAISNHRILACVDLMNDDTVSYSSERTVKKTEVDYVGVIICSYIVRTSKEDESTTINVFYYHTKSKQLIEIKALKFKTNDIYLDSALFVMKNLNCIKFSNYTVKEAGSDLMFKYVFK